MRYAQFIVLTVLAALPATAQTIAPLSDFADFIDSPALSPDGNTLAFTLSLALYARPFRGRQDGSICQRRSGYGPSDRSTMVA
jgi:hypothetical protein